MIGRLCRLWVKTRDAEGRARRPRAAPCDADTVLKGKIYYVSCLHGSGGGLSARHAGWSSHLGQRMRRRQFFTLLGSMAIVWPIDADAQKPNQVRRIGVLMPYASDDMAGVRRAKIFAQGLHDLGWTDGWNARIDYRWPDGDIEKIQAQAKELVSSRPDVLVGVGTPQMAVLQQATRTTPIVFLIAGDAVDEGLVERIARPGGNATGFFALERSMGGKWLELLKEIAPGLRWVAVIFNPETAAVGTLYLRSVETAAALFSVKATGAPVHHAGDLELAISPLAREPGGGLIVLLDAFTVSHRQQIIELAAQYRLPTIYPVRDFAADGGLLSYGIDILELYRGVGSYVGRLLNGASPPDLPVQSPTKFEFVINLKTAKALGLAVPATLLARADEVIE
jgi:putative tryptophan/tyrosine transport system substrate-binding protein